jgi:hypothetical protein
MNTQPFKLLMEFAKVLSDLQIPWYVAGGWAIDLY